MQDSTPNKSNTPGDTTVTRPDQDFAPVTGGGAEMQSGEVLLVEAYAAFWLLAFFLIFLSFRKQRGLDERIRELREDLERARAQGD